MKLKYHLLCSAIIFILGAVSMLLFVKHYQYCFKNHELVVIDSFESAMLKKQISRNGIVIDSQAHVIDSIGKVKQKVLSIVTHEVQRVKTPFEVVTYIEQELGDTNAVEIIIIKGDSFLKIDFNYNQALYNLIYEGIAYKELYYMSERQLKLQDSSLILCLSDVDLLMASFLTVEQQNNSLRAENKTMNDSNALKDAKIQKRNRWILGLVGADAAAATLLYVFFHFR